MNNELLTLHERVNAIIYNPFVNLKDQIKEVKKLIDNSDKFNTEIQKLEAAILSLDEFESLPYGNLERIKGFNKIKSSTLKIIKQIQES